MNVLYINSKLKVFKLSQACEIEHTMKAEAKFKLKFSKLH